MQILKLAALPLAALAITACESEAEKQADVAEDRMETQAEQSAAAAGMAGSAACPGSSVPKESWFVSKRFETALHD